MTDQLKLRTGRCLCGAIAFTATTKEQFGTCYCKMCQQWSSGAFMGVTRESFEVIQGAEHLTVYESSTWATRAFCSKCGANIYYHAPKYGGKSVALGTLDDTSGLQNSVQYFIDAKPEGFSLAERTKIFTTAELEAMNPG